MTPDSVPTMKWRPTWDIGFTPLTEKERSLPSLEEEQPFILCQYCRMLFHEMDRTLFGPSCMLDSTISAQTYDDSDGEEQHPFMSGGLDPDPNACVPAGVEAIDVKIPNTHRRVQYQEIHESAVQGCLSCTIIDIRCYMYERREEFADCAVDTELSATYHNNKVAHIRIELTVSVKDDPDQCIILPEVSINTFSSLRYKGTRMRPISSLYTASRDCLNIGQSWLQRCLINHQDCPRFEPDWMPTRVIAITGKDQASLVETHTLPIKVAYYALSYCWGTEPVLTTERARYEEFKQSIPIKDLPCTIQDAIKVVHNMGGRYLWVDSMCIVQDDAEDWQREATTMCDVYQHALLTIVALGASGAKEGLFSRRDPRSVQNCDISSHLKPTEYISILNRPPKHTGIRRFINSKFHTRGWTFQERALAPRKLYFSSHLFWECNNCSMEEGDTSMPLNYIKPVGMRQIQINPGDALPDADGHMGTHDALQLWYHNLRIFTQRDLSVATDRLPAISGVMTDFSRKTGWTSINGIWSDFLAVDLLWLLYDDVKEAPRLMDAPTWSWTSIAAPIKHHSDMRYRLVENTDVRIDSKDPTILHAEGVLLDLRSEPPADISESSNSAATEWIVHGLPSITDHVMYVDRPEDIPHGPHFFLPLIMADLQDLAWEETGTVCMGLALVQAPRRMNCFERFGVLLVSFDIGVIPSQKTTFRRGKIEWPDDKWRDVQIV